MRPELGAARPMASRISVLLPLPFGPMRTVVAPPASVSEISSTMGVSPARSETLSKTMGSSLAGARMISTRTELANAAHAPRRRVDNDDEDDEDEPEAESERKIAFRGFERDGGGHGAGEAVDVAANDHHSSDLGRGAPETRE